MIFQIGASLATQLGARILFKFQDVKNRYSWVVTTLTGMLLEHKIPNRLSSIGFELKSPAMH
jgi:hypothetical protein